MSRVAAGYHQIDTDVVTAPQDILGTPLRQPVIHGTGQEHKEHTHDEKDYPKRHLPAESHRGPRHPDAGKRKHHPYEVRPSVTLLCHWQ